MLICKYIFAILDIKVLKREILFKNEGSECPAGTFNPGNDFIFSAFRTSLLAKAEFLNYVKDIIDKIERHLVAAIW